MKLNLSIFTGVASLAALMSGAFADTATTDPVGYITTSVNAASPSAAGETLLAPTLVTKTEFAGAATNAAGGTATMNFTSGVGSFGGGLYYVEIKATGWVATIGSSTATSITLAAPNVFPAGTAIGAEIIVRKHHTLATYLAPLVSASPGLVAGTSTIDADEVLVLNPTIIPQQVASYFYYAGDPGTPAGFYDAGGTPSDDVVIDPGTSVKLRHKAATAPSFVTVGHVKTTPTQVDLYQGENWADTMVATGVTLELSKIDSLITGTPLTQRVDRGSGLLDADEVQLINSNGSVSAFFAADGDDINVGVFGWFDAGGSDANPTLLGGGAQQGRGFTVVRKVATQATVTIPKQVIAP
jgi:hypothetical protein